MESAPQSFFTRQYFLLCISSFLFFGSFNMILMQLPSYLTKLGGEDYKGWIIALFTVAAALSRPISGRLTDKVGRIPVMVIGAIVSFAAGLLYPFVASVWLFLALRFFHGFSTGFKPTGTIAYIADIVPAHRRGEALGFFGLFGTTAMALTPKLGDSLSRAFGINAMFILSSVMAILSVLILLGMKETLSPKQPFKWSYLKLRWQDSWEPRVLKPFLLMLCSIFSYGVILTVVPDFSDWLQLENRGDFFLVFTLASLAIRFPAGIASDRFGRIPVLMAGMLFLSVGMLLVGLAKAPFLFFVGAGIYGLAAGINNPTMFAWAADLSSPEHRGKAMATLFIGLEAGIFSGSLISASIYDNQESQLGWPFLFSAGVGLLGLAFLGALLFRVSDR